MKILFQIIGLFLFITARSQNMVMNGDLEDFNICEENHAKCSPAGWFFIKADPIGYMNPGKMRKTISASGNCHFNIMVADTGSVNREYWLTKLLCTPEPEKKYRISFKMSSPRSVEPDLSNIGLWFTDQMIYASKDTLLQPEDFIGFADAKIKPLDNGWFQVTKEITASKTASILVLGNFSRSPNKEIIVSRIKKNNKPIFVFVDDISMVATKKPPCFIDLAIRDTLYAERRRHTKLIPPRPPFFSEPPVRIALPPVPSFQKIEYRPNGFSISSVQFAFDRFEITDYAVTIRLNVLKMIKNQIKKIEVVGYTDEIGYLNHNLELSRNRSLAVAKLLTDEIGIDPAIIQVRGAGVSHQFKKNELNRRVDIHIDWK